MDLDDEATSLNRYAIVLTPKAPFIAWANGLDMTGPDASLEFE